MFASSELESDHVLVCVVRGGGVLPQHCVIACVDAAVVQRQMTLHGCLEILWVGGGEGVRIVGGTAERTHACEVGWVGGGGVQMWQA